MRVIGSGQAGGGSRRQVVVLMAVLVALASAWRWGVFHEDAYITLRYSRHVAEGAGWVWNRGGAPIEGLTNLLWGWLLSWPLRWGVDGPLAGTALGLICLVGWLLRLPAGARALGLRSMWWLPLLVVGGSLSVSSWAVSGLETVAVGWLAWELLVAAARGWFGAYAAMGLVLFLLRPDGLAFVAAGAVLVPRGARVRWLGRVGLLAVGVAGVTLWRLQTFGDVVPNTAHVKVGASAFTAMRGVRYILDFATTGGGAPLLLAAVAALLWPPGSGRSGSGAGSTPGDGGRDPAGLPVDRARWLALICFAWLAYVVYVGGDYMYRWRFLVVLLAPLATLLGGILERLPAPAGRALGLVTVLALSGVAPWTGAAEETATMNEAMSYVETVGRYLATLPGEPTVASNAVGAMAWYSDLPFIDMLGLNDRHIATQGERDPFHQPGHQLGDGTYVLDQEPDLIVIGAANPVADLVLELELAGTLDVDALRAQSRELFVSDRAILEDPRFARYRLVRASIPHETGVFIYFQRD